MARNNYQKLVDSYSLSATASEDIDLDLFNVNNLQLMIEVTYQTTSTPTGVTLDLLYGFGGPDSDATGNIPTVIGGTSSATFGDTADSVTMETISAGSGSPQTVRTVFYITDVLGRLPRWLRLRLENTDAAIAATISIYADA